MTDHFVSLSCLNCGQQLDVYDDMERFFCGKCGAGALVERRGGTVVLKPLEPVSAEAPPRDHHRPDIQSLSRKREEILTQRTLEKKQGFGIGASLLLAGLFLVKLGIAYLLGLFILLAGIVVIVYVRRKDKSVLVDLRVIDAKIDALNGRNG